MIKFTKIQYIFNQNYNFHCFYLPVLLDHRQRLGRTEIITSSKKYSNFACNKISDDEVGLFLNHLVDYIYACVYPFWITYCIFYFVIFISSHLIYIFGRIISVCFMWTFRWTTFLWYSLCPWLISFYLWSYKVK